MVAIGMTLTGEREILGFGDYDNESKETWQEFFKSLKARGLSGVRMITSDVHEGICYTAMKEFPEVP